MRLAACTAPAAIKSRGGRKGQPSRPQHCSDEVEVAWLQEALQGGGAGAEFAPGGHDEKFRKGRSGISLHQALSSGRAEATPASDAASSCNPGLWPMTRALRTVSGKARSRSLIWFDVAMYSVGNVSILGRSSQSPAASSVCCVRSAGETKTTSGARRPAASPGRCRRRARRPASLSGRSWSAMPAGAVKPWRARSNINWCITPLCHGGAGMSRLIERHGRATEEGEDDGSTTIHGGRLRLCVCRPPRAAAVLPVPGKREDRLRGAAQRRQDWRAPFELQRLRRRYRCRDRGRGCWSR